MYIVDLYTRSWPAISVQRFPIFSFRGIWSEMFVLWNDWFLNRVSIAPWFHFEALWGNPDYGKSTITNTFTLLWLFYDSPLRNYTFQLLLVPCGSVECWSMQNGFFRSRIFVRHLLLNANQFQTNPSLGFQEKKSGVLLKYGFHFSKVQ